MEDTWFELSPAQKLHFDEIRRWNSYLCERYHSLRDILWRSGYMRYFRDMPRRLGADGLKLSRMFTCVIRNCVLLRAGKLNRSIRTTLAA